MKNLFDVATCVGCGCDDDRACMHGCGWLRLDRTIGRGVCTSCRDHLGAWDEGAYADGVECDASSHPPLAITPAVVTSLQAQSASPGMCSDNATNGDREVAVMRVA